MDKLISYFSFVALVIVVILLVWSLILARRERSRKVTARSRMARLRGRIEAWPEKSDEDRQKKEELFRELILEYLDSILGEVERFRNTATKKNAARAPKKKK